jgi:hydroxyacylglutathione hydrolase
MTADVIKVGPLGPFANNAYIIVDHATKQSIFVDAPIDSQPAIDAAQDSDVQRIVVTHRHPDHWGGIDAVQMSTGAATYCHDADREPYAAKVHGTVGDGDTIEIGDTVVRVLHTPGHTPGSICLLFEDGNGPVLISGDTLFPGGPGRSANPDALRQVIESITSKLLVLDPATRVLPGHGADTTIGEAKREYESFASREHPPDLCGDVTWTG